MESFNRYCESKARKSGSSFFTSFLFLEPRQYQALCAVYAYCREIDDIVDENPSLDLAEQQLAAWALEIERVFEGGQPQHPVGLALQAACHHFAFSKIHFDKILQGMRLDLHHQSFEDFNSLVVYCEHVASAVGLLSIEIFGYQDLETQEFARLLGISLQLVNIIRDVKEDVLRGRLYIPQTMCQTFQVTSDEIFS